MIRFRGKYSTPTDEQFLKIGRIVTGWAIIDVYFQEALSRLALAPTWPANALTDNVSFVVRFKALKSLIEIHRIQFQAHYVTKATCDKLEAIAIDAQNLRPLRNHIAHWIWMRMGDQEIIGVPLHTRVAINERKTCAVRSNDELDAHIDAVDKMCERFETILDELPEQPSPFDDK